MSALEDLQAQVKAASRQMQCDKELLVAWLDDAEAGGVDVDSLAQLRKHVDAS